MLCQNCGENEANFKYTQIINGVKKQMILCNKCAKEMGLEDINFNMPIDFSSFFGDMLGSTEQYMPSLFNTQELKCDKCNMTYDEFLNTGKFGCEHCYETFESKINPLLKSIQGGNKHTGRLGKTNEDNKDNKNNKNNKNTVKNNVENKTEVKKEDKSKDNKNVEKIEELKQRLKKEIQEERYEDAAKTRDEIKKLEG